MMFNGIIITEFLATIQLNEFFLTTLSTGDWNCSY